MEASAVKLKSIESEGMSVELFQEDGGATYRINVRHDGQSRTRVFTNPVEAFDLFESYRQGN